MKLALIGCGDLGLVYAGAAHALGLEIAFCADRSLAAARKAATRCRAKAKTYTANVLKQSDIEAVLLCAPLAARATHVRDAAALGLHVLCVPPFALDAAAARVVLDAARASGARVYVAHDSRVAPEDLACASQLDAGAIGRPGFVRVHRTAHALAATGKTRPAPGESAIAGLLARDLDWLTRRFGPAGTVYAQAVRQPRFDHAALTLTFPRGPIAQLIGTISAAGLPDRVALEVCGTGGMIQFTTDDPILETTGLQGRVARTSPSAPDLPTRHLQNFQTLLQKSPTKSDYENEFNVACTIEAALRSARTGRELRP